MTLLDTRRVENLRQISRDVNSGRTPLDYPLINRIDELCQQAMILLALSGQTPFTHFQQRPLHPEARAGLSHARSLFRTMRERRSRRRLGSLSVEGETPTVSLSTLTGTSNSALASNVKY